MKIGYAYGTLIAIAFVAVVIGICAGICSTDYADADATFTVDEISDVTYDGYQHKKSPVVKDSVSSTVLTVGIHYTVSYSSDVTNVGTVTVTVTGKGSYLGDEKDVTYDIKGATITGSVYQKGTLTYNGTEQSAEINNYLVSVNKQPITVTYSSAESGTYTSSVPGFKDAGSSYTVYYKANAPNHNEKTGTFIVTINQKSISGAVVTLNASPVYNGTEQTQTIASVVIDSLALTESDYNVTDNKATEVSERYLNIVGKGNFTGSVSKQWSIQQATQIISFDETVLYKSTGETFTNPITKTIVYGWLYYTSSKTSVATVGMDTGEVTTVGNGTTVITATVTGNTNYAETTATYTINTNPPYTKNLFKYSSPSDLVYSGSAKSATVTFKPGVIGTGDITVRYYSNITRTAEVPSADVKDVGTYYVAVDVTEGTKYNPTNKIYDDSWYFSVTKAPLTVTANAYKITYGDAESNNGVTFTGFVVGEDESVLGGSLAYDYTYDTTDPSKRAAGTYDIIPSGLTSTNYDIGFVNGVLTVEQRDASFIWTAPAELEYDGNTKIPSVEMDNEAYTGDITITVGLTDGKDNVNAGKFTFTVSSLGNANYSMSAPVSPEYEITKRTLTVTADELSKIFMENDPEFTYTYANAAAGETPAFSGKLTRESGEEIGKYQIKIGTLALVDSGAFKGSNYKIDFVTGYFSIIPITIVVSDFDVDLTDETYDGTEKTKTVTSDLVKGVDYTVGYIDNIKAGTATIYITGCGNYSGVLYYYFIINMLGIDMPEEQYYIETGSVIYFDLEDNVFYTETSGRPHYGTEAGTYPFVLTPTESCFWNDTTCTGAYNVYITLNKVIVKDDDGDVIGEVTGDKGIRKDILITITGTDDVSSVKKALESVDGTPKFKYIVKFQIDGKDVIPEGNVILKLLVPNNVCGRTYEVYSVTGDTASEMSVRAVGSYVAFLYEGAPEYAFVTHEVTLGSVDMTFGFFLWLVIDLIIACYILGTCIVKRRKE